MTASMRQWSWVDVGPMATATRPDRTRRLLTAPGQRQIDGTNVLPATHRPLIPVAPRTAGFITRPHRRLASMGADPSRTRLGPGYPPRMHLQLAYADAYL